MSKRMRLIKAVRAVCSISFATLSISGMYISARNPLVNKAAWIAVVLCEIWVWAYMQNEFKEAINHQRVRDRAAARKARQARREQAERSNIVPFAK